MFSLRASFACIVFLLRCTSLSSFRLFRKQSDEGEPKIYLVLKDQIREISDADTLELFGYASKDNVPLYSESGDLTRPVGTPVGIIKKPENNPDDILRAELDKIRAVQQKEVLRDLRHVGRAVNPAVVHWKGRLLMGFGLTNELFNLPADDYMRFRWMNDTLAPYYNSTPFLGIVSEGIPRELPPVPKEGRHNRLLGQDGRMIVTGENRVHVSYTNRYSPQNVVVGIADIVYDPDKGIFRLENVFHTLHPDFGANEPQKNWVPFIRDSEILYVQHINPLHIVRADFASDTGTGDLKAETVSKSAPRMAYWSHGEIRGGTNAVNIGDRYIAFFHSRKQLTGNHYGNYFTTYFMGAYTFSHKNSSQFELLAMSPVPITPPALYNGPWDPIKPRKIDYCIFPMSLFKNGEDLVLSIGHNDVNGYLATFDLQTLLDSLVPLAP